MTRRNPAKDGKDMLFERLDPNEPWIAPVAHDLQSRLHLNRYLKRWRAAVLQKRMRHHGFTSFVAIRKYWKNRFPSIGTKA